MKCSKKPATPPLPGALAKSELINKKTYNLTLLFWVVTSYIVGAVVYTVGSWWWTAFIWALVAALAVVVIKLYNLRRKS